MSYHRENCKRKRRYRNWRQAQAELDRRRSIDPRGVDGVSSYRCPFCRGYHLGHVPSLESLESLALEVRGLDGTPPRAPDRSR